MCVSARKTMQNTTTNNKKTTEEKSNHLDAYGHLRVRLSLCVCALFFENALNRQAIGNCT